MKRILPTSASGFTLIEMLVVAGIMGVMLVGAVASYNRMDGRVKVKQAASSIESEIRLLQKQVDSGKSNCPDGEVFGGIQVSYNSSIQLKYQTYCGGSLTGSPVLFPIPSLPSGVSIVDSSTFVIYPLGKGFSDAATINITDGLSTPIIRYQVLLTPAGGISVKKIL